MLAYHFTEMPYPYFPPEAEQEYGTPRVLLPNRFYDPNRGGSGSGGSLGVYRLEAFVTDNTEVSAAKESVAPANSSLAQGPAVALEVFPALGREAGPTAHDGRLLPQHRARAQGVQVRATGERPMFRSE